MNDKLSKSVWQLFEAAKDTTKKNLVTAVTAGQLKVDENVLPVLLTLVNSSIDEGFNKGHKNFLASVTKEPEQKKKK
jgi:hypothetical protein